MKTTEIVITNVHDRGFAFGCCLDDGDQVFIPPFLKFKHDLEAGEKYLAQLAVNIKDGGITPWQAVSFAPLATEEPAQPIVEETIDERVFRVIRDCDDYVSVREIAEILGAEHRTAGNAADRLFKTGRVAKADVYNRVGQQRVSFLLYAMNADDFLGEAE